jgi:hypothetical protein
MKVVTAEETFGMCLNLSKTSSLSTYKYVLIKALKAAAQVLKANVGNFIFIYESSIAVRISFRASRSLSQL